MRDEQAAAVPRTEIETDEREAGGALPAAGWAVAAGAAVAACGGGSSNPAPVAPSPAPPAAQGPSSIQASRFLGQAAMGASKADIASVQQLGFDGWLSQQFAAPRQTAHWDWLVAGGYADPANINSQRGFDATVWRQLIGGTDQLRQRVGMALLDFLVVGIDGLPGNWQAFNMAAYLDVLMDNAFGNYRTLLERISTNAAMGAWLTFLGNRKANPNTGSVPDENYARELMQLFAIGLVQLNQDGTPRMTGGQATETYTQEDVSGLARVFTGFVYPSTDSSTPARYRQPLIANAALHETGVKTFLGGTVPAGTDAMSSLRQALDIIFAHPNVAPFVSKQLIQRLVTSNPSPGYVARVAAVFDNNGSGVKGDLRAVVRTILLDTEARGDANLTATTFGKLRAPVNRLTGWARAFGASSPSDIWNIGNTSSQTNRLGQSEGRSPSVFNFFRPGYTPPNTAIATQGLVAPEFQITNELSTVAYINYMQALIAGGAGVGDFRADYTDVLTRAGDAQALVDEVNLLLAAGQVSAATLGTIRQAVESIAMTVTNGPIARVYIAILLTLASPEFIAQK